MEMNRKDFIRSVSLAGAGLMMPPLVEETFGIASSDDYVLPKLNYAFDALEPYIDAQTMQIHYEKHHQAYITKLNEAVQKTPSFTGQTLENLFSSLSSQSEPFKTALRNHGGGHWNHSFFWKLLKKGTMPSGKLGEAIQRDFGSLELFQETFQKAALGQFGSGWAWLISKDGKLSVTSTANQENPLMDISKDKGKPVLGLDVWEHAYYLKYQNRRADYVKSFWSVVNWEQAESNFLS